MVQYKIIYVCMYVLRKLWKIAPQKCWKWLEEDSSCNLLHLLFYCVNNFYNEQVFVLSLKKYFREIKQHCLVVHNICALIHSIFFPEMLYQMRISG